MKKLIVGLLSSLLVFSTPVLAIAQGETQEVQLQQEAPIEEVQKPEEFCLAQVKTIIEEGEKDLGDGTMQPYQIIKLKILNGGEKGKEVDIEHGSLYSISDEQKVKNGDLVVLTKSFEGGESYYIADMFRLHVLAIALAVIVLIWAILGRGRNLGMVIAILGTFSVAFYYLIPNIIKSENPYTAIIVSSAMILAILVFVGYGLNRKTVLTFISSLVTALLVLGVSYLLFKLTGYTGAQSDKASFYLQNSIFEPATLKNLFMASVVTSALGVIAYLAHKQIELVEKIKNESKKISLHNLYKTVLINPANSFSPVIAIVFMVYLGMALTIIWLFNVNPNLPFWVTFNSEYIYTEILKILISMASIVLVVPVASHFAITFLPKGK